MPHVIFECSNRIKKALNFECFFIKIHKTLSELLPTNRSNCKSRVIGCDEYFIGTNADNLFIHLTVKILPGRSEHIKNQIGQMLLNELSNLTIEMAFENVSISTEVLELSPHYFK